MPPSRKRTLSVKRRKALSARTAADGLRLLRIAFLLETTPEIEVTSADERQIIRINSAINAHRPPATGSKKAKYRTSEYDADQIIRLVKGLTPIYALKRSRRGEIERKLAFSEEEQRAALRQFFDVNCTEITEGGLSKFIVDQERLGRIFDVNPVATAQQITFNVLSFTSGFRESRLFKAHSARAIEELSRKRGRPGELSVLDSAHVVSITHTKSPHFEKFIRFFFSRFQGGSQEIADKIGALIRAHNPE